MRPLAFEQEILHFHVCGGAGGGAKGFNRGQARVGHVTAKPRCIGAVDVDPAGILDFNRVAGVAGTVIDLFTADQFAAFHGRVPPAGWREATPDDFRRAAHGERPHVVFMSTPCKGFSGLLSDKLSTSAKYQALNGLTLRAVWLTLEAWADDPPEFILFENVPRIATRGRWLLDQIEALLSAYGYVFAETVHDCGVLGGLAQSRKRFLLVARHAAKVPPFLYEPEKKRLRGVGEVLDRLPLPGDPIAGPMHRVPSLQWKTWVRLAFVEAGSDWRSLNRLRVADGMLQDFAIAPDARWRDDVLGVLPFEATAPTVTGKAGATTGRFSVADPREFDLRRGALGTLDWSEPAGTVTSRGFPYNGGFSVADPRVDGHERSVQMGVRAWDKTAGTVTGNMAVGAGPNAVADPRLQGPPRFNNVYRIVRWGDHSPAVAGPGGPSGGLAVADPRALTGFCGKGKYRVTGYAEAAGTVIGGSTTGQGAFSLADPRTGFGPSTHHNVVHVVGWDQTAKTITGANHPSGGALSVADPRCAWAETAHRNKLKVVDYDGPAGTVTGSDRVGSGALCVADPRPDFARDGRKAFQTGGHFGVTPWAAPAGAVTGSGQHDNGRWSVADPREAVGDQAVALPAPDDRLVAVIRALDGTWHRPFTTFELAALQSYVDPDDIGFTMAGTSDSAWRERIGNMVPADSAAAIMGVIARTLLLAKAGETFMLSSEPIWVRPVAIALAVDVPLQPQAAE